MKSRKILILIIIFAVVANLFTAFATEDKIYTANILGQDHFQKFYIPISATRTVSDIRTDLTVGEDYVARIPNLPNTDADYWMRIYMNPYDSNKYIATGQNYDIGFSFTAPSAGTYRLNFSGNCPSYDGTSASDGVRMLVYVNNFAGAFTDEAFTTEIKTVSERVYLEEGQCLYFLFNKNGTTYTDGLFVKNFTVSFMDEEQSGTYGAVNWGFEDGSLNPFRPVSDISGRQLISNRSVDLNDGTTPLGKEGTYFLSTLDLSNGNIDEAWTGSLVSKNFYINSTSITLKLGGGAGNNYVALCRASDNEEIATVKRSYAGHLFENVTLNVPGAVVGSYEEVYLKITDDTTSAFAFITVDDIRFNGLVIYDDINWGFEDGTKYPFEQVEDQTQEIKYSQIDWSFENGALAPFKPTVSVPGRKMINNAAVADAKDGDYYISTLDLQNGNYEETWKGTLVSSNFYLNSSSISLKIGGGGGGASNPNYVALCRASDGTEIARTAKIYSGHYFEDNTITVPAEYVGTKQEVYLKIVDNSTSNWAFIYVDAIKFEGFLLGNTQNIQYTAMKWSFEDGSRYPFNAANDIPGRKLVGSSGDAAGKDGTYYLSTIDMLSGGWEEGWTGSLVSNNFYSNSKVINLKIGGGGGNYVALCRASDGAELSTASKQYSGHWFEEHTLTVPDEYIGTYDELFIKVVDNKESNWAFIYVDDIRFTGCFKEDAKQLSFGQIQWNFEGGTIAPFTTTSSIAGRKMAADRVIDPNTGENINKEGTYYLSTIDMVGGGFDESWVGSLTSSGFYINSYSIQLKLGGSGSTYNGANNPYVALCRVSDGTELSKATKLYSGHHFEDVTLNVPASVVLNKEEVCLKIVENLTAGWGFAYVDNIVFEGCLSQQAPQYEAMKWSFEDGKNELFTATADITGRNLIGSRTEAAAKDGTYYLSTLDMLNGGIEEDWKGSLISESFYSNSSSISLKIGGGKGNYVALCRASDGAELATASKTYSGHWFEDNTLTVPDEYVGTDKALFIKIVDNKVASEGWAFIYVDDICFEGRFKEKIANLINIYDDNLALDDMITPNNKKGNYYLSTGTNNSQNAQNQLTVYSANLNKENNWDTFFISHLTPYSVANMGTTQTVTSNGQITQINIPQAQWGHEADQYANLRPGSGDIITSTGETQDIGFQFTAPEAAEYKIDLSAYSDAWNYSSDGVSVKMFKGETLEPVGTLEPAIGEEGKALPPESFTANVTLAQGESIYFIFNKKTQNWSDHLHIQKLDVTKIDKLEVDMDTSATGVLKSMTFDIQHPQINMKLAGGSDCYVALYRASDDSELARVQIPAGQESYVFKEYSLLVPESEFVRYEEVYLKIVDNGTGVMGFIAVDDFRMKGNINYVPESVIWSFEDGKMFPFSTGKNIIGRDFVVNRVTDVNDGVTPVNKDGQYFFSTLDVDPAQNDGSPYDESWIGDLQSREFYIYSNTISLKMAGGADGNYVALCLARNDEEVATVQLPSGSGSHIFSDLTLNVPTYLVGSTEAVYLKIVDGKQSGWGFISIDDIRFEGVILRNNVGSIKWSFEDGTIAPFVLAEGELGAMIGSWNTELNPPKASINKDGTYYFMSNLAHDGINIDDTYTGVIRTPKFVLTNPKVSFKLGGGSDIEKLYVALCREDGTVIKKETSPITRFVLNDISWDLTGLVDSTDTVYLEVADKTSGGWGNLIFDDFEGIGYMVKSAPAATQAQIEELTGWNSNGFASLRNTVKDLSDTYGSEYPNGTSYLSQISSLEATLNGFVMQGITIDDPALIDFKNAANSLKTEIAKTNPLLADSSILFVSRYNYAGDHHPTHTMFPSYEGEYNVGSYTPGGAVKILNMNDSSVSTLLENSAGVFRDPDISYDGTKILLGYRKNQADSYHIYEGILNSALNGFESFNQLTSMANVDDYNPLYMPSGNIVFNSTRDPKYVQCNRHISSNIYRMEADGANIVKITNSNLFEQPTDVLPDGRIIYDRWEYVDRDFGSALGVWTVNEDGTQQNTYYGNNSPTGSVIDGKSIPGTNKIMATLSSTHDRPWGGLAIINNEYGVDGRAPIEQTWPASAKNNIGESQNVNAYNIDAYVGLPIKYSDPQPLNEKYFLASRQITSDSEKMGIYLLDIYGNETLLYEDPTGMGAYDATLIQTRQKEITKSSRRNYNDGVGTFFVQNVYKGTGMEGVQAGEVKYLRVVQAMEKRYFTSADVSNWLAQGQQFPGVNWHSFEVKRVLGTVPVYEDGSAYFEVPQDAFVYFQLLDKDGRMIQSMRSGTLVQSGEQTGCIGCHDDRRTAPSTNTKSKTPLALQQNFEVINGVAVNTPDKLTPYNETKNYNYLTEVQPIFNESCVSCHGYDNPAGNLTLVGDKSLIFNASYIDLWRNRGTSSRFGDLVGAIGAGTQQFEPAKAWGSYVSPLMNKLYNPQDAHFNYLSAENKAKLAEWVDLNGPYYPDYSSNYQTNPGGHSPLSWNEISSFPGGYTLPLHFYTMGAPLIYFDNPAQSPILDRYTYGSADYNTALNLINLGKSRLEANPDTDMPGYTLNALDSWRAEKTQIRKNIEAKNRLAIKNGIKIYDFDHELTWPTTPFPGFN